LLFDGRAASAPHPAVAHFLAAGESVAGKKIPHRPKCCLISSGVPPLAHSAVDLRICKSKYAIPSSSELLWIAEQGDFIMSKLAKPVSDDTAFAKHFIESARMFLQNGELDWCLQALGNCIEAVKSCKALKKKADGAA